MIKFIGVVKKNENGKGVIEVYKEYEKGLHGIDEFSHLIVISWLHQVTEEQRNVLIVRPRRLTKYGYKLEELPEVGVFCTDSPHRPNPIGITIVRLTKREGNILYVENLDLFEGTPVIDIKAFTPARCPENVKVPQWVEEFENKIKQHEGNKIPY